MEGWDQQNNWRRVGDASSELIFSASLASARQKRGAKVNRPAEREFGLVPNGDDAQTASD
jgi:hypothetical protein